MLTEEEIMRRETPRTREEIHGLVTAGQKKLADLLREAKARNIPQGHGRYFELHSPIPMNEPDTLYSCAVGAAAQVALIKENLPLFSEWDGDNARVWYTLANKCGLSLTTLVLTDNKAISSSPIETYQVYHLHYALTGLNDVKNKTFEEIAAWVESLRLVFLTSLDTDKHGNPFWCLRDPAVPDYIKTFDLAGGFDYNRTKYRFVMGEDIVYPEFDFTW